MNMCLRLLFVALLVAIAAPAHAEPLTAGSRLPELRLADQHDVEATVIGTDVQCVLFSRDMDGGNVVKETLAENGGATLAAAHAVYISDISRMPGLVTKLFAMPAMRKREYRIFLDRDGKATAELPSEDGKVTILEVGGGFVSRVRYVNSIDGLRAVLTAP